VKYKAYIMSRRIYDDVYLVREPTMGWLWSVGSIKVLVSFAKEPYKRDNILPKRPIILFKRDP